MSGPAFFQTRMGATFYEHTLPRLADELARLNTNLEALVIELRTSNQLAAAAAHVASRGTPQA